ncbi:helix-turn-helix transcriptional regulator [Chryseobacterium wangxinyae]|uniref:helix-turn-helix transcriptional regulator n=1 Tax=Chryseobacterium sp. CY353 TaxID=2997334 RepID=UPI0022711A2B|nr:helix-turn-helix domain-containing protein [Chryseobacterium sp. CY353]MCY0971044.1 helix-turn-helix domain-containing protein [Chryseobacterium sp. CY353]
MENTEIQKRLDKIEQLLIDQSLQNKLLFNIDEVAAYTGLSKLYLYKLTSKNEIPHYKPNGKNIFFKKDEIDTWLLRNRQATNEELETEAVNYSVNRLKGSL